MRQLKTAGSGASAIALLALLAWLSSRTTLYVVTSRRLVMKVGVALPVFFNLPFSQIASASLRVYSDGAGDIPVALTAGSTHRLSASLAARPALPLQPTGTGAAIDCARGRCRRYPQTCGRVRGARRSAFVPRGACLRARIARGRRTLPRTACRRLESKARHENEPSSDQNRHDRPGRAARRAGRRRRADGFRVRRVGNGPAHRHRYGSYAVRSASGDADASLCRSGGWRRRCPGRTGRRADLYNSTRHKRLHSRDLARADAREEAARTSAKRPPFLLIHWSDGTLSLEDPSIGRKVDLDAFGPTQAEAFAQLFTARSKTR